MPLVEIGSRLAVASVEQLHHWELIDFAAEPVWGFDSMVGMGWKHYKVEDTYHFALYHFDGLLADDHQQFSGWVI